MSQDRGGRRDAVDAIVRTVPGWQTVPLTILPLAGGITNRNYRVDVASRSYVVRLPGERTEVLGIDRANEAEAAYRAALLGIGPPVLCPLPGWSTLVTELVPGHHVDPAAALGEEPLVGRLVDALKRFHDSGPIAGLFPIHRIVEAHASDAAAHGVDPPDLWNDLHPVSRAIETAFGSSPMPAVPCHNDLLPANVLLDGERVWILDWEYAGRNDAFFDLANLSVNCRFDAAADEAVLRHYFGAITPAHVARLELMKIMSELREGMWAVVQQAISTLTTDFEGYARERLTHCLELSNRPEVGRWLRDAARLEA